MASTFSVVTAANVRDTQTAARRGIEVQASTRDRDAKGFKLPPLRWRSEGSFGILIQRCHDVAHLEGATRAKDAVTVANCDRLVKV